MSIYRYCSEYIYRYKHNDLAMSKVPNYSCFFFFCYIILFLKYDKYFCNKIDFKIIIDEYDVNNIFSYLYILFVLWRK